MNVFNIKASFRYKFIISFLGIELVFLTLIILLNFNTIDDQSEKLIKKNIETGNTLFANLVATPLMVYDLATIDNQVKGFTALADVSSVHVYDNQQRLVSSSHHEGLPDLERLKARAAGESRFVFDDQIYQLENVKIQPEDYYIGKIYIVYNLTGVLETITENRTFTLLLALTEVIISIGVSFLLGKRLTQSLEKLTRATELISEDESGNVDLNITSGDELEQLANAVQSMQQRIQDRNKRLEEISEELKEFNKALQSKVEEEVQKNREKDQLLIHQARFTALGEMIGAIAHQWRQPLNTVALLIQDVEDAYDYKELNKEYLQKASERVMSQVNYMSKTIDSFRNFFAPSEGPLDFLPAKTIEQTLELMQASLNNDNIEIITDLDHDANIFGYQKELQQVLLNILSNAREILEVRKIENKKIFIRLEQKDDTVYISIEDNGKGIAPEMIDKVFDPYFTTKHKDQGRGLGMFMAKIILEKHMKGSISVTNTQNGALFQLKIKTT